MSNTFGRRLLRQNLITPDLCSISSFKFDPGVVVKALCVVNSLLKLEH
jgi:hypothetical protein